MSWTVAGNVSSVWSVSSSASTSFQATSGAAVTFTTIDYGRYVEVGYVADGYVDRGSWLIDGGSGNTWSAA